MQRVMGFILALVLGMLIAVPTAGAAFPGRNGKIVFQGNRDGNNEIYTMNADGSNRVNLSRNLADDARPAWSPDGRSIVFASNRGGSYEVYSMNADGSSVKQLTALGEPTSTCVPCAWQAGFTPDGQILFHDGLFPRSIFVMNADGSGLRNLTGGGSDNAWAVASPKGGLIAFSSTRSGSQRLYTMNMGGRNVRLLIPNATGAQGDDAQADWSPNGNDIVFGRFGPVDGDIYLVHKDGTGLTQITNTPSRIEYDPVFSPDGSKIVFEGCSDLGTQSQHCGLYSRNPGGSGETEVTRIPQAPYLDTFSGDRIDPFWHTILFGSGSQLAQTSGRLEETIAADAAQGGPYDNIDAHVGTNCKLVGDFDVQADYSLLAWPGMNGVQVALNAFEPGSQVLRESQLWGEQYGAWIPPNFTSTPTADLSGSLRLTRVGTTITGYYRAGNTWQEVASGTTTLDDATIGLSSSSFMDRFVHQTVSIAWDNFLITSGQLSCPWWWSDGEPDWQSVRK